MHIHLYKNIQSYTNKSGRKTGKSHLCALASYVKFKENVQKKKQLVSNKIPIKKFNDGKSDKSTELLKRLPRHILYQR